MTRTRIEFSQDELEAICRQSAAKRLALFGGRRIELAEELYAVAAAAVAEVSP